MANTCYVVAFMPDFTFDFKAWVRSNIFPNMSSTNGTAQYSVNDIFAELDKVKENSGKVLFLNDKKLLEKIVKNQEAEYVEF